MSESGDYTPAQHWGGHNFASARKAYKSKVVDRGYTDAKAKNLKVPDLVPTSISTDCEAPLVIAIDVTGSMGDWPATIFSKLPYLEHEGKEYLGEGMEISFCAVGDSHSDQFPLQVREFAVGKEMKDELESLVIEGNGGGQGCESYDFPALYYSENCNMPEAVRKPIFIFIGDEGIYDIISSKAEEWCRVTKVPKKPETVFNNLKKKFNVYCVRKAYSTVDAANCPRQKQWEEFLGADKVVPLPEADRVVDVIFGILAKETGRIEYFEDELKGRQGKDADGDHKINVVLKSLHSIHKVGKSSKKKIAGPKRAVSVTRGKTKGKGKSISLLDD